METSAKWDTTVSQELQSNMELPVLEVHIAPMTGLKNCKVDILSLLQSCVKKVTSAHLLLPSLLQLVLMIRTTQPALDLPVVVHLLVQLMLTASGTLTQTQQMELLKKCVLKQT
jgi:hypothetical protein